MPSYLNDYFGLAGSSSSGTTGFILKITDGDLTVDFTQGDTGWFIDGPDGWPMLSAGFKGGGVYASSNVADAEILKFTAFANVVDGWRAGLNFYSTNGWIYETDKLEELLKVRAPRYWQDRNNNQPVYIVRRLGSETNIGYALISQGMVTLPGDVSDCTNQSSGIVRPITVAFNRQPFWLGAAPGEVQDTVEMSATQIWNYSLSWGIEDTLPAGQVLCMAKTPTGTIWAGGASEILYYDGASWAVATTTPVTLGANVASVCVLANGDVLFGESSRIIKRTSAGVWSVETSSPSGSVTSLFQVATGEIYAGDNGNILKRSNAGAWTVDATLPASQVYAFIQSSSSGRIFAGENKRILRTTSPTAGSLEVQLSAASDSAEQYGSQMFVDGIEGDMDYFNRNYVAMRFALAIPPGATITSAKLRNIAHRTHSDQSETAKIYCQAADNASAFTSAANNISGRTLTTHYTSWSESIKWKSNNSYDSPDFSAVLQEVIDRGGWTSGNYAAIIVKSNTLSAGTGNYLSTRREAHGYGSDPGKAVILLISYVVAASAGSSWEIASTAPLGDVRAFHQYSSIGRIIAGDNSQMLATHDNGQTWPVLTTFPTGTVRAFAEAVDGTLYASEEGAPGQIIKSSDKGANWSLEDNTTGSGDITSLLATTDGVVRAGDNGNILKISRDAQLELGQTETDENWVFTANHHKTANLTHVYQDDGGVFSALFPAVAFPFALFPATPAVNDAVYFGCNSALNDGAPFGNIVLNIETPAKSTTSYTIVWEFWGGAAWATLTTKDGTSQLSEVGVNSVAWAMPSNWATTAVNGITGWWVRARLSALTGTLTPPTQASRDIYSAVTAFLEIDEGEIEGTVDSLAKLQINNRSAGGGPGGSNPPLYATRILAGVKPVLNSENFRAFLNFSTYNNPDGVSIDTTVDSESATSVQTDTGLSAASGKRTYFNAAAVALNTMRDRVSLTLATTIARDYYGDYNVFLRCKQNGGSAGQVSVRLKVVSGSGGISQYTDTQYTATTSDHHLIIFEQPVSIPVSSLFTDDDIGDTTSITVQVATASNSAGLYLYDLFLLPVSHSYVDAEDKANAAGSAVDNAARLLVDSITVPKVTIRALAQKVATDHFKSSWRVDSRGPFTLLKAQTHRVWILTARAESAGSTVWISEPEVLHSARAWKVDRFLRGRGLA